MTFWEWADRHPLAMWGMIVFMFYVCHTASRVDWPDMWIAPVIHEGCQNAPSRYTAPAIPGKTSKRGG